LSLVKHNLKVTTLLIAMFLLSNFLGLLLLSQSIDFEKSKTEGKVTFKDLAIGERPPLNEETSYLPLLLSILVGTGIVLLLIKYKLLLIWKLWFFLATLITLTVVFGIYLPIIISFIIALVLAYFKIFKPYFLIHTITEILMYPGLALIFVPLFNLTSISILLVLISIYDAYAVWKSKHMITLAKSQSDAKVFAGFLIPYEKNKIVFSAKAQPKVDVKKAHMGGRVAMLGGGDVAFPLLFAGVVLKDIGIWQAFLIPVFAGIALTFLLVKGKEGKFYPAMPFISAGCFIGLGIVLLL